LSEGYVRNRRALQGEGKVSQSNDCNATAVLRATKQSIFIFFLTGFGVLVFKQQEDERGRKMTELKKLQDAARSAYRMIFAVLNSDNFQIPQPERNFLERSVKYLDDILPDSQEIKEAPSALTEKQGERIIELLEHFQSKVVNGQLIRSSVLGVEAEKKEDVMEKLYDLHRT
jgi:hypothetical protein